MVKGQLILIVLIYAILPHCQSGPIVGVVPQYSPYFASGAVSLIATSSYECSATITYKLAMKSSPQILLSYHSVDYDLNQIFTVNSSLLLNIDLFTSNPSLTGFTAIADISTSTQLKSIKYAYFVFDNAFPYINSFDFVFVTYYNRNQYITINHSSISHLFTIWLWGINLEVYPYSSTSAELFQVYWDVNYVDSYTTGFYVRSAMTNYNKFKVRAIVMTIYPTTIPKSQYQVETFFIHTLLNTTSTYQSMIFAQGKSHVITGLNSFRLDGKQNLPQPSFTFDVNHQITGLFTLSYAIQFDEVAIHGFIINFMGCPSSHPFKKYNSTTSKFECHQSCATNQYERYDYANGTYTCGRCVYPCDTCSNTIICITCVYYMDLNSTFGCELKNTYTNISGVISLCSNSIDNCTTCLSDGSECIACVQKYALSVGKTACVPCSGIDGQCATCTYLYCLSCNSGYVLFNSTSCVVNTLPSPPPSPPIICDSNCSKCNSSNQHYCLICNNPQYILSNGICISICGDGKIMGDDEQCDDRNVQDFDGCSSQCKLEQGFTCVSIPFNLTRSNFNTSVCKYTSTISFVVRRMVKDPYSNYFTIYIETPIVYASVWSAVNLTEVVVLSGDVMGSIRQVKIGFDNVFLPIVNSVRLLQTSTYYPKNYCYISVQLLYNSTIQGKSLTININPSYSGLSSFQSLSGYQSSIKLVSNNNILANFYDKTYSNSAHSLQIFSQILSIVSFVMILVGGIFGNMMITLEASFICQLTYFSLLEIGQLNPFWYALSGLKFSSGYNFPFSSQQPIHEEKDHSNFIGIGMFSSITDNINISLGLIVLTLLIGAIMKLLIKFAIKKQQLKEKLILISNNFIGSVPFYLLHCFALLFTISIAINFMTSSYRPFNYVIIALCLIAFISLLVFYIKCHQTQFFSVIHQKIGQFKFIYLTLGLVLKVVIGVLIVMLGRFVFGCVIVGGVYLVWGLVVVVKLKPYVQANNIRFVLSLVLCFSIQLMFIYQRISTSINPQQQNINLYLPLSIIILLFITLSLNLAFYLYSIRQIRCCQLQIQWQRIKNNTKTQSLAINNRCKIHQIEIDDNISQKNCLSHNVPPPNVLFDSKDNINGKKLSNKFYDTTRNNDTQCKYQSVNNKQMIDEQNPLNSILNTQQQHSHVATTNNNAFTANRQQIQQQIKRQLKSCEMNYSRVQQIKGTHAKSSLLLKDTDSIYSRLKRQDVAGLEQSAIDIYSNLGTDDSKEKYVYTKQEKYCALQEYGKL